MTAKQLAAALACDNPCRAIGRALRHEGRTKAEVLEAIVLGMTEAFVNAGAPLDLAADLAGRGARALYEELVAA